MNNMKIYNLFSKMFLKMSSVFLLIWITPLFLMNSEIMAQSVRRDTSAMVIDKKYTITFQEEIKLKTVKKTPRLKQIEVEPERNPVPANINRS